MHSRFWCHNGKGPFTACGTAINAKASAEVRQWQATAQSANEELTKLHATLQHERPAHEEALRHLRHTLHAEGTLRVKEAKLGAQGVIDALTRHLQVRNQV
jgi:hypothetical protein